MFLGAISGPDAITHGCGICGLGWHGHRAGRHYRLGDPSTTADLGVGSLHRSDSRWRNRIKLSTPVFSHAPTT